MRQPGAEFFERLPFRSSESAVCEAVDRGELEVGHAAAWFDGQQRAVAVDRDDVDARQAPNQAPVDDNERPVLADRGELHVERRGGQRAAAARLLLEQPDDGPAKVRMDGLEAQDDVLRQGDRDELAGTSELRQTAQLRAIPRLPHGG